MKQQRLNGLADGIFSIVMTLLVIELKVPMFKGGNPTEAMLVNSIFDMFNLFMSLVLSFALLFTYWRAHHFIVSVYAKNLTVGLANINALFFFFIVLVPFVAHFLGEYPQSQVAVTLYGMTVIAIGLTLFYMRQHIERDPKIETSIITKADRRSG
ncbi:MAG: potassium channel family protein, partial [Patescibacteria group bacterium]|nr:potassium channel family protein [Patescibacteria group bacterium]